MTTGRKRTLLELAASLLVPILIITVTASCSAEPKTATGELASASEQPMGTRTPRAASALSPTLTSPSYDVGTYGDLKNLDPSHQVVTFWHQHSGAHEELLLSMVDEFNRTNEWGITVIAESQRGCDDLYEKLVADLPANRIPNMATICQGQAATYAALGGSVALDTYVQSPLWGYSPEELGDFFSTALVADYLPQFEAYYGWPSYRSMEVLYYNEDWLAQLGYENPPGTWDEFAEISCAAIKQPFSGIKGEGAILGYEYVTSARHFATLIHNHGGDFINKNGTAYIFNSPEVLGALAFLKDMSGRGCAGPTTKRSGDRSDFSAGRVLFTISTTDHLPDYREAVVAGAGFRWSVSPPPHSADRDGPRMNLYGASHSIFKSTPERQLAAWLYIRWMSEPEQQARWTSGTGYYPARRSVAGLMAEYFAQNPTYQKAFGFASLDHGIEPPVAGHGKCRLAIEEMFIAAMTIDEPQSQLDATLDQCNEYLKEALP